MRTPEMITWLGNLAATLTPLYTMPNVYGAHDILHVKRMIALGPKIQGIDVGGKPLVFDEDEYETCVWFHNLDRIKKGTTAIASTTGIEERCYQYLEDSPFSAAAKDRIVIAILEHSKVMDELNKDSSVLTALRIADKIDSLGAMRTLMCAAHRGSDLPFYDAKKPFPYKSIEENRMGSIYDNLMRSLRWYGMLPSDAARGLVPLEQLRTYVAIVRAFGAEIAAATGFEDRTEDDIKRAINEYGSYYHLVAR